MKKLSIKKQLLIVGIAGFILLAIFTSLIIYNRSKNRWKAVEDATSYDAEQYNYSSEDLKTVREYMGLEYDTDDEWTDKDKEFYENNPGLFYDDCGGEEAEADNPLNNEYTTSPRVVFKGSDDLSKMAEELGEAKVGALESQLQDYVSYYDPNGQNYYADVDLTSSMTDTDAVLPTYLVIIHMTSEDFPVICTWWQDYKAWTLSSEWSEY